MQPDIDDRFLAIFGSAMFITAIGVIYQIYQHRDKIFETIGGWISDLYFWIRSFFIR